MPPGPSCVRPLLFAQRAGRIQSHGAASGDQACHRRHGEHEGSNAQQRPGVLRRYFVEQVNEDPVHTERYCDTHRDTDRRQPHAVSRDP